MSFEGRGSYTQDPSSRRGRGKRGRGAKSNHQGYNPSTHQQHQKHKQEGAKHTKDRVKEELEKDNEENRTYTKFQLLEIFSSVEVDEATKLMTENICDNLLVNFSQSPVVMEEEERKLTLEDLKPRKGPGGPKKRSKFNIFNFYR